MTQEKARKPNQETLSPSSDRQEKSKDNDPEKCFVMMPFSDASGYADGHFSRVYKGIIKPACALAGYHAHRLDDDKETTIIHESMVRNLYEAPIAICDLSSNNPNVLFELRFRQAFNKPTVIIKDDITESIFDISLVRYTSYRRELRFDLVEKDIEAIAQAIKETRDKSKENNSLISFLSLSKASVPQSSISPDMIPLMQKMDSRFNDMEKLLQADRIRSSTMLLPSPGVVRLSDRNAKVRDVFDFDDLKNRLKVIDDALEMGVTHERLKKDLITLYDDFQKYFSVAKDFVSADKHRILMDFKNSILGRMKNFD